MKRLLSSLLVSILLLCLCLVSRDNVYADIDRDYIFITAAHINESNFPSYTLIYKDVEKDLAIYLDNEYTPILPRIGDIVTTDESRIHGVVNEVNDYGFYVLLDGDSFVISGDSGTPVYIDNTYYGYISYADTSGRIFCVAY